VLGGPSQARVIEKHDNKTTRCRRLGHEVYFGYCRQESEGDPCRLILDCWWQSFDVQYFLKENLTPEACETLQSASAPSKILTLFDLIEQAKARMDKE